MAEKWIPDFSKWQGKIDFKNVKEKHDAVILRASCGRTKDDMFDTNIQSALKNGLKVGVYHYLCGYTPVVAVEECKSFYSAIKPYKDQISFFVLDFEDAEMLKLTNSNKIKLYHAFSDRLRDTYQINNRVLYTWQWLGEELKNQDPNYDFAWEWYANYGVNDGYPHDKVTKGWLYQFTSKSRQDYDQSTFTDMSQIIGGHTLAELCGEQQQIPDIPEEPEDEPTQGEGTPENVVDRNGDGRIVRVTNGTTWNVRTGPGTEFSVTGVAKFGAEYEYIGTAVNSWIAILFADKTIGWISGNAAKVVQL